MQRLFALLALAMMALPLATAQSPQTGIFYWCSFVEGGSNINSISFGAVPRTTILGLSQGQNPLADFFGRAQPEERVAAFQQVHHLWMRMKAPSTHAPRTNRPTLNTCCGHPSL